MAQAACSRWPWPTESTSLPSWGDDGGLFAQTEAVPPIERTAPHLQVLGENVKSLSKLPVEEYSVPFANVLTEQAIDRYCASCAAAGARREESAGCPSKPRSNWETAAAQAKAGRLKVAVVGVSATGGGGASEPWGLWRRPSNLTGGSTCLFERSWSRRMAEALNMIAPARVSTAYKNAVGADYYTHCPSAHVPRDATVVLIEVTPNVYGGNVGNVLLALRRVVPHAAMAFVLWPSQAQFRGWRSNPDIVQIRQAAAAHGADVIDLPALMAYVQSQQAMRSNAGAEQTSASSPPVPDEGRLSVRLWANRGADVIHPSPEGHLFIGAVAARCVWRGVLGAMCGTRPGGQPARPLPQPQDSEARERDEVCYTRADTLPVASGLEQGWSLVDEGARNGVKKLGLLSQQVGSELDLKLWPEPGCRLLQVGLGYLVSLWRRTLAGFTISCPGCAWCVSVPGRFPKLNPFPEVQAWAPYNDDDNYYRPPGMTVTATTTFLVGTGNGADCRVRIKHVPASGRKVAAAYRRHFPNGNLDFDPATQPKPNASEVRIDSLTVSNLDFAHDNPHRKNLVDYAAGGQTRGGRVALMVRDFNSTCENAHWSP